MNNKNLNIVCEILKLRCGERLYVREDMKSCAFDNTIVPMYADIKTILRSFFTNADNMIMDMTLFGYPCVSLIAFEEAKWRNSVDMDMLTMSVKASDEPRVRELLVA